MDARRADVPRCDLHVHSIFSTDSGNFALRRARLGESFTEPERVYRLCRLRGMRYVTISDHNTLEGALRIAHLPDTFLSEEVTTRFPEDDVVLHVLAWNLTEDDHRDLQPERGSVYALVELLRERSITFALAHPLYRMGAPITPWHVERLMLLFDVWEGRNGARQSDSNVLACRLAQAATPPYLAKLAERHGIEPRHGSIALTGGSDDHGGLDVATTWTEAQGETQTAFLEAVCAGRGAVDGEHGSTEKLAHAVAGLFLNAYRRSGRPFPEILAGFGSLFDSDAVEAGEVHEQISTAAGALTRSLSRRAREGLDFAQVANLGPRLTTLLFAAALHVPYLATARHHSRSRIDLHAIESAFFGVPRARSETSAIAFTDTFDDTNGVAGTMRRLAREAGLGALPVTVVTARDIASREPGFVALAHEWSLSLPAYTDLELHFPHVSEVLRLIESSRPDVVHVSTPGPVGLTGLAVAKLLGIPVVGAYHTELGPYALQLTQDLVVAELTASYVDWFYRQCDLVLAPSTAVATRLAEQGMREVRIWGRGVDSALFSPERRDEALRRELLGDGELLLLSVGRISREKRLEVLLDAFEQVHRWDAGLRLVIVGDGPGRASLESDAPEGVRFVGEERGERLAALYASADLFCFPSTTDTFGQVILEAQASGLPVVAAEAGGASSLVEEGATGFLTRADDAVAMAAAIALVSADDELRAGCADRAVAAARERTWERSYAELLAAYREAGEAAAAAPPRVLV